MLILSDSPRLPQILSGSSHLCIKRRRHDIFEPVAIEEVIEALRTGIWSSQVAASRDPIDVLIGTILSQNTSDANSGRAFASLKASFDSWEAVASAPAEHIAQVINPGDYPKSRPLESSRHSSKLKGTGSYQPDSLKSNEHG